MRRRRQQPKNEHAMRTLQQATIPINQNGTLNHISKVRNTIQNSYAYDVLLIRNESQCAHETVPSHYDILKVLTINNKLKCTLTETFKVGYRNDLTVKYIIHLDQTR